MINDLKFRWQTYATIKGYSTLEHEHFLAFKSPNKMPWHNMVYASANLNETDWNTIKDFFGDFSFRFYNPSHLQGNSYAILVEKDLEKREKIWEMIFERNLQQDNLKTNNNSIELEHIRETSKITTWLQLTADAFEIPESLRIDIATPIFEKCSNSHDFFIAYQKKEPIGTCFTCTDIKTKSSGLYAVSISKNHRRKGLATSMIQSVINSKPIINSNKIVLRSCHKGLNLYSNLGFKQGIEFTEYETQ